MNSIIITTTIIQGADSVTECVWNGTAVLVQQSYNPAQYNVAATNVSCITTVVYFNLLWQFGEVV